MTDTIRGGNRCITLTDRWGHDLVICELPPDLSDREVRRLYRQILACFGPDLGAGEGHLPERRVYSWPEVVLQLARQRRSEGTP